MAHIIIRRAYLDHITFGDLLVDSQLVCNTVEREWADNKANISCIPEGEYFVERYNSPRHGECWIVSGGTVDKFSGGNGERWGILLHAANYPTELAGCIAPVAKLMGNAARLGGGQSRNAFSALNDALALSASHTLSITHKSARRD